MAAQYQYGDVVRGEVLEHTGQVFALDEVQHFMKVRFENGAIEEVSISTDDHLPPVGSFFQAKVMNALVRFNKRHELVPFGVEDDEMITMLNKITGIVPTFGVDSSKRASYRTESSRRKRLGLLHFSDDEFFDLMNHWQILRPVDVQHNADGVRLRLENNSHITITRDRVTCDASNDETARALVLHAKEFWNGGLYPLFDGQEDVKARVWAHAQVHGVKYGWEPSPEVARAMQPEINRLRAAESVRVAGTGSRRVFDNASPASGP